MSSFLQWRAFVGPRFHRNTHACYYAWWNHAYGDADTYTLSTTANGLFGSGEVQLDVVSSAGWPSTGGGAWILPSNSSEQLEYVGYEFTSTNQLSNTHRNNPSDHASGSVVKMWYELDTNLGELEIVQERTGSMASSGWKVEMSGVFAPLGVLLKEHLVIIQRRSTTGGTWTNWVTGFIDSVEVEDDHTLKASWKIQVVSLFDLLKKYHARGVHVGDFDLARGARVIGSEPLKMAYKERYSGDFADALPDLSLEALTDGNPFTPYISEQIVGSENFRTTPNADPHWKIEDSATDTDTHFVVSGVYLRRPAGYDTEGYRWIELTCTVHTDGETNIQDCLLLTETVGHHAYLDIGGQDYEAGEKLIICENRQLFEAINPVEAAAIIVELDLDHLADDWASTVTNWWDTIDVAGDSIAFHQLNSPHQWQHGVCWGTGSGTVVAADWISTVDDWTWDGSANVTAPAYGQVMRYIFEGSNGLGTSTDPLDYWSLDYSDGPGYMIGNWDNFFTDDTDGMNQGKLRSPWVMLTLPGMGLYLRDAMTAVSPAVNDSFFVVDGAGITTSAGLPSSGTFWIGGEQFTVTELADGEFRVDARGIGVPAALAHSADDPIYVMDGSIATDAQLVEKIGWVGAPSTIYPADFRIFVSSEMDVRTPEHYGYENDFTLLADITGAVGSSWSHTFGTSQRIKHVLIECTKMTTDPARFRLSGVYAYLDSSLFDPEVFVGPMTVGQLVLAVLDASGVDGSDVVTLEVGLGTATDLATEGRSLSVSDVVDLLTESTGYFLQVNMDSQADFGKMIEWWPPVSAPGTTFDRSTASMVTVRREVRDLVDQVSLRWRGLSGDGEEEPILYPAGVTGGNRIELNTMVVASEAQALSFAEERYTSLNRSSVIGVTLVDGQNLSLRYLYGVDWTLTDGTVIDETIIPQVIVHQVSNNVWRTSVYGVALNG